MPSLRHLPRTLLTLLVGFFATGFASVAVIVVSWFNATSPVIERVTDTWSRLWLRAAGVDLRVVGRENVDAERSYVVVANHSSNLDIMACFVALPLPIRFLAKKELFRIPLLAAAMRDIGIVEVDRQARTAVHEQINSQARDLVDKGRSLIVYPEGTRSVTGKMGPFKKGAFTIAVSTGIPILPVAIIGAGEAWRPHTLGVEGGEIVVEILPPIETAHLAMDATNELRDRVREQIRSRVESGQS